MVRSQSKRTGWFLLPALVCLCLVFSLKAVLAQQPSSKVKVPLPKTAPAPKDNPTTPEKVALGQQLFFDPRLSGDNQMSCATCHRPDKSFADGLPRAKGFGGKILNRNTPSLLNVGFYSVFLWDGRARSLEEQALAVIQAADEMNQDLDDLEKELNAVPDYVKQFQSIFGTGATRESIARALAAFERTLVTGPSPYDRYLSGEKKALSLEARKGMELFFGGADCGRCHRGPLLSDEKFYRLSYSRDQGRAGVTGKKDDVAKFRTPSLRNIARTGPFMHDGSVPALGNVLEFYYRSMPFPGPDNLSLDIQPLTDNSFMEITDVLAFLESLTGEEPKITAPELP